MTVVRFKNRPLNGDFNKFVNNIFHAEASINKLNDANKWPAPVAVNIRETENAYLVDVIAPGFSKEDFDVKLEKDLLTISGEIKTETEENNGKFIRREYQPSSFKRSFTIDENTDADSISAQYVNGVLTLNLPVKQEVKISKQITIQ